MKTFLTKSLLVLALLVAVNLPFAAKADSIVYTVTGGAVTNFFTTGKVIDNITCTATTTNITTFRFYDTMNTTTSIVRAAYQNYQSYATNITQVFTNEAGLFVTNTFSGIWTYPTSVSAVTNSRPALQTIVVPASSMRSKDVRMLTIHGLAVVPTSDGIVEITYRNNP